MAKVAEAETPRSAAMIDAAICRSRPLSAEGARKPLFEMAFSNFVYAQIWEDPVVDLVALALDRRSRIITIASGGCNVLNYLTAGPAHITAVDINAAHVTLIRLKLAAARHLPDYDAFYRFFGAANTAANVSAFRFHILPHLDPLTASYWHGRHGLRRSRRIRRFTSNLYRTELLGTFIGASHLAEARTLKQQRNVFNQKFAPLFDRRALHWLVSHPASLYGLGIPPAQYKSLAGEGGMADVRRKRLERLACSFPLLKNYFAWQAFGRRYAPSGGALPPYLDPLNFALVRENASRVSVHHASFTSYLAGAPNECFDRYVLLDAQDWMGDAALTKLWREITRTARPGARVIFRTASEPTILPGRIPEDILSRWDYAAELSLALTLNDRSAIYKGFHLYVMKA